MQPEPAVAIVGEAFRREERYIVVKRKHLHPMAEASLRNDMRDLGIQTVECVVVESDWPEYETVWKMIEARAKPAPGADEQTGGEPFAWADGVAWHKSAHRAVLASVRLGAWLSAALDDPAVCDAMKADINEWFSAGEPMETLGAAATHFAAHSADLSAKLEKARLEAHDLRATIARIRSALDFVEPVDNYERDRAIAADLDAGMSLRKTAAKHGASFSIVRTIDKHRTARQAPTDMEEKS